MLGVMVIRGATFFLALVLILATVAGQASAEGIGAYRGVVGSFTNDYFGDTHDRWISGSYQRSYYSEGYHLGPIRGVELRTRSEIVTPWTPSKQPGRDRPFSTAIGVGGFAHGRVAGLETRLGGEVLILGEDTGLGELQNFFHDGLGMEQSFDPSRSNYGQVENGVSARFDVELARAFPTGSGAVLRPYVEFTFGGDQAVTAGADVVIGSLSSAEIWTRDVVTGRLLTPQVDNIQGLSLIAGWDARSVNASVHIPTGSAVDIEPVQYRARAGIQSSTGFANLFIGQAWFSEGFVGQAETQRVGMLSMSFGF